MGGVKLLLAGLVGWTAACLAILLFYPAGGTLLGCMRLVGRSVECEAAQEALNRVTFLRHTLPVMALILTGYLVIAAAALVRRRSRERLVGEVGVEPTRRSRGTGS